MSEVLLAFAAGRDRRYSPSGEILLPKGDILPYLTDPTPGVVVLENGVYTLGDANHVWQYGVRNGHVEANVGSDRSAYRYVMAETPGGVVVDMGYYGQTSLDFTDSGTIRTRLGLGGISFINGTIKIAGACNIFFYYCQFERSPQSWMDDVISTSTALGLEATSADRYPLGITRHLYGPGTSGVGLTQAQWNSIATNMCSMFGPIRVQSNNGACQDIGFFGCDVTRSLDDGFYVSGTIRCDIVGCNVYGVTEYEHVSGDDYISLDPGHEAFSTGQRDWWHNDAIQIGASGKDFRITDNWLAGRIMWGDTASADGQWGNWIDRNWFGGQRTSLVSGGGYSTVMVGTYTLGESEESIHCINISSSTVSDAGKKGRYIRDNTQFVVNAALLLTGTYGSGVSYPASYTNLTVTGNVEDHDGTTAPLMSDVFDFDEYLAHPSLPSTLWRSSPNNSYNSTDMIFHTV